MQLQLEREVSICERNNSAHNKVIGEGRGKRCSRHWSRDPPLVCGEDHGEAGCVLASSQRLLIPHAVSEGPQTRAGGCPKNDVTPWEAHAAGAGSWQDMCTHGDKSPCWAGLMAGPMTPWRIYIGAVCCWRTVPLGKGPMLEQFVKNCSPWEGLTLEKFVEWPHNGTGEGWGGRSSRENVWWTDHNPPHSPSPCTAGHRKRTVSKIKPRKKADVGEKCF